MVPLGQHDEGEAAPRHVVAQLDLLRHTIRARVRAWERARGQWVGAAASRSVACSAGAKSSSVSMSSSAP